MQKLGLLLGCVVLIALAIVVSNVSDDPDETTNTSTLSAPAVTTGLATYAKSPVSGDALQPTEAESVAELTDQGKTARLAAAPPAREISKAVGQIVAASHTAAIKALDQAFGRGPGANGISRPSGRSRTTRMQSPSSLRTTRTVLCTVPPRFSEKTVLSS